MTKEKVEELGICSENSTVQFAKILTDFCTVNNLTEYKQAILPTDYYLNLALWYASKGFFVFPVNPNKIPFKGFKWRDLATNNPNEIKKYWKKYPNGRPAFSCEKSNVFVVDIDNKPEKRKFGIKTLQKIINKLGKLPKTVMIYSPSGGIHLYFKHPRIKTRRNEKKEDTESEKIVCIDFQNKHYCLCGGVFNEVGRSYRFVKGYTFDEVEIAELPKAWIEYLYEGEESDKKIFKQVDPLELECDIKIWAEKCAFIKHCIDDAEILSETDWFRFGSILGKIKGGEELFDLYSQPHPDYESSKVKQKFLNCKKYSACGCETIAMDFDGCKNCKYNNKKEK